MTDVNDDENINYSDSFHELTNSNRKTNRGSLIKQESLDFNNVSKKDEELISLKPPVSPIYISDKDVKANIISEALDINVKENVISNVSNEGSNNFQNTSICSLVQDIPQNLSMNLSVRPKVIENKMTLSSSCPNDLFQSDQQHCKNDSIWVTNYNNSPENIEHINQRIIDNLKCKENEIVGKEGLKDSMLVTEYGSTSGFWKTPSPDSCRGIERQSTRSLQRSIGRGRSKIMLRKGNRLAICYY